MTALLWRFESNLEQLPPPLFRFTTYESPNVLERVVFYLCKVPSLAPLSVSYGQLRARPSPLAHTASLHPVSCIHQ